MKGHPETARRICEKREAGDSFAYSVCDADLGPGTGGNGVLREDISERW